MIPDMEDRKCWEWHLGRWGLEDSRGLGDTFQASNAPLRTNSMLTDPNVNPNVNPVNHTVQFTLVFENKVHNIGTEWILWARKGADTDSFHLCWVVPCSVELGCWLLGIYLPHSVDHSTMTYRWAKPIKQKFFQRLFFKNDFKPELKLFVRVLLQYLWQLDSFWAIWSVATTKIYTAFF